MLNIGNVTLLQDMIGIHSCETLLLDRVYWVRNTLECNAIPEKKERQVLRVLKEKCCRSNEIRGIAWVGMNFVTYTSEQTITPPDTLLVHMPEGSNAFREIPLKGEKIAPPGRCSPDLAGAEKAFG
jgi:hypothetical protein